MRELGFLNYVSWFTALWRTTRSRGYCVTRCNDVVDEIVDKSLSAREIKAGVIVNYLGAPLHPGISGNCSVDSEAIRAPFNYYRIRLFKLGFEN